MVAKNNAGLFSDLDAIYHAGGRVHQTTGREDGAGSANHEAYHCLSSVRASFTTLLGGGDTKLLRCDALRAASA